MFGGLSTRSALLDFAAWKRAGEQCLYHDCKRQVALPKTKLLFDQRGAAVPTDTDQASTPKINPEFELTRNLGVVPEFRHEPGFGPGCEMEVKTRVFMSGFTQKRTMYEHALQCSTKDHR